MKKAKIITLWSPVAGIGTSFTALNLAKSMGEKGLNVALFDFDSKTPSLHIYLESQDVVHSLDNVIPLTAGNELTPQVILNNIQRIYGFNYLRGTDAPEQAQYMAIESLTTILETSKSLFDYIIVDTHSVIDNAGTFVALDMADTVLMLTERNAISIYQYSRTSGLLLQNFDTSKFKLLINKCHKNVYMEKEDLENYYELDTSYEIPLLDLDFINSINQGKLVDYLKDKKANNYKVAIEEIIAKEIVSGFEEIKTPKKKKKFSLFKK